MRKSWRPAAAAEEDADVDVEVAQRSFVALKAKEEICFSDSSAADVNSSSPWFTFNVPLRKLSRKALRPAHLRPPCAVSTITKILVLVKDDS